VVYKNTLLSQGFSLFDILKRDFPKSGAKIGILF